MKPLARRRFVGLNCYMALPVATTAMVHAAVAEITGTLSGRFQRRRTAALDPLRQWHSRRGRQHVARPRRLC
jgi:hypothetical protein